MEPSTLGVLVLETARGERTYWLAARGEPEHEPPVLDWRTAPLADPFFRTAPGEPYVVDAGERSLEGRVIARSLVIRGELVGEHARPRPAPPPGPATQRALLPVLDADQQRAVDLADDVSLVVDGEAGVGKTLVALYRVAALARRAHEQRRRFRALVLVPTEGLRRLVSLLAERLEIPRLEIATIESWLVERARQAFPGLPERTSDGARAQVIALKRHPAVRAVLGAVKKQRKPRRFLLHLFGERVLLERVAAAAQLPARAVAETLAHTRAQFESTTERANRHVDADRLVALDGRRLDAGTPAEDAESFDAEDAPVLFELARRGALAVAPGLASYDHIVVDEAQLRAPMELAAIGDALVRPCAPPDGGAARSGGAGPYSGGTVTLAGDHRQATDDTAYFTGWPAARGELPVPAGAWHDITLAVSYRSVPAIADFARAPHVPSEPPPDPAVWATACSGPFEQAAALCWHLAALVARDPWRQIAVIARTPEHARRLHGELARGVDPELVLDGDFRFQPGIVVTTAAAVAGLEFDAVVIPDLTPAFYPATPELARALYVAATRARDWLWLVTPDAWSPLIDPPDSSRPDPASPRS
jgi:hypothetical protein|nr:ATP-binding domain-containing protein [Kofleriaceae bacterium]